MQHEAGPPFLAALVVVFVCLALGALTALEARHVSSTHGFPLDWGMVLISTMPRWVLLAIVLPFVLQFATRVPLVPMRTHVVAIHVAIFIAVSLAHAATDSWAVAQSMPEVVHMFAAIPRLARSWYNTMPTMVSLYAGVLIAAWGMNEARERRRRTLRASQLEAQLQTARLAALRAQLQPHFLYNTLNGIAALVADVKPARAVAAIEQLAELLHASLREDGREEVTVTEEVALAERYLALQRMRFGERLKYQWRVAPEIGECLVPVLLLQPIVENAVVHGLDAGQDVLNVQVEALATAGGVELLVENDGPELLAEGRAGEERARQDARGDARDSARGAGHGVGLATTRARLITAYGDLASLALQPRDGGGVAVRIVIPRKTEPAAVAPTPALQETR